jgi:signal transduction histidine kinase
MKRKRSPFWFSKQTLLGVAGGGLAGVAVWFASASPEALRGALALLFLLGGCLAGLLLAYRRREKEYLAALLDLREEIRFSQDHIMESETFRSLGAYLEIAAHQMKEPLQALVSGVKTLAADASLPDGSRQAAAALGAQADALQTTLRHVVSYTMSKPGRAPFSVNTLLREAILLCRHRAGEKKITIEERYAVIPPVMGSAGRVHQAILNVVVNAVEAMPFGGGTISVETAHENDRVVARVRDTGIGIRPEQLPHIFEPFFTTKPEKRGVGLGLWAARKNLDLIGADIGIKSAPFQGTEVTLTFPQAAPIRPGREGTTHPPEIPRNTAEEVDREIA